MTATVQRGETELERFASLFERAPAFMAQLAGPEHRFEFANAAYMRVVGHRPLIGLTVLEALPDAVAQGYLRLLDDVFRNGKSYSATDARFMVQAYPGGPQSECFVDFVYQPTRDEAGAVTGVFVQGIDVTERVHSQNALRVEAARAAAQLQVFETLLSSMEDFAYTFDRQGRFTFANKPLLDLLGLTHDQVVGKAFPELPYPAALGQLLHRQIAEVFDTGERVRGQTFYASPTGEQGWYEYIFSPVSGPAGSVVTVVGSTRNVTRHAQQERRLAALNESERAARAEAERASRLKDDFLATLGHELRTPLNAIVGWAELLRTGHLTGEKAVNAGARISRSARAQGQLISDLLDMSGVMSGKVRLNIERVVLSKPLNDAVDSVRLEAARKRIDLTVDPYDEMLRVDCDPGRMQQVFWNLLTNAVKFTPAQGSIVVSVEVFESNIEISITDTGLGIEPAYVAHMFKRFSQADSSSTRQQGGLGLGLSISSGLIQMHGGQIRVHSHGSGTGARLTVVLPATQIVAANAPDSSWGELDTPAPTAAEGLAMNGVRVLVVDDDDDARDLTVTVLGHYGAVVVGASGALAALAQLADGHFDIVICDISMPEVDGYELLRRIGGIKHVPVIALTAFARIQDEQSALEGGFAAHIGKPATPATIVRKCVEVLAEYQASPASDR